MDTGECVRTLKCHHNPVKCLAFSRDSLFIASATQDGTVQLWRANTGECVHELSIAHRAVSVAFSHDLLLIASASIDAVIGLWDTKTGACVRKLTGHTDIVTSVAFSHNSSLVASASKDKTIRLWRADKGDCIQEFKGHHKEVTCIALSSNSPLIASASRDKTIRLWYTNSGECIQVFEGHTGDVLCVVFSHDSSIIASASDDHTIRLWDINIDDYIEESDCYNNKIIPPKPAEISGYNQGIDGEYIGEVAISHDSSLVASLAYDNTVRIWHADTGDCVQELRGWPGSEYSKSDVRRNPTTCLIFSPDSSLVAFALEDETLQLWSVNTGECVHELKVHKTMVDHAVFSHDSSLLASISLQTIQLWRIDTGDCVQIFKVDSGEYYKVAISRDSWLIAVASDFDIKLWSVITGKCVRTFTRDDETWFHAVAFTHDSSLIVVNVLWLPAEYRPNPFRIAANNLTVAAFCNSGRVWSMRFLAYPH